jgi:hypothetical protein
MKTVINLKASIIPEIDKQIFIKIWNSPGDVFQFLSQNEYNKNVDKLLILGGISNALNSAVGKGIGGEESLVMIILMCSLIGLCIWPVYYIYADLLNRTGKWLNAQGNFKSLIRILAYALIPIIFGLVIQIILILLFGNSLFKSDFNPLDDIISIKGIVFYLLSIIYSFLTLWSIILIVIGVSVVQRLSIVQSIINCLLALAPFLIFKLIIYFLN